MIIIHFSIAQLRNFYELFGVFASVLSLDCGGNADTGGAVFLFHFEI